MLKIIRKNKRAYWPPRKIYISHSATHFLLPSPSSFNKYGIYNISTAAYLGIIIPLYICTCPAALNLETPHSPPFYILKQPCTHSPSKSRTNSAPLYRYVRTMVPTLESSPVTAGTYIPWVNSYSVSEPCRRMIYGPCCLKERRHQVSRGF